MRPDHSIGKQWEGVMVGEGGKLSSELVKMMR